jgi:ABC-type transport system involved in cytochrome c biogenesis permease subunit
MKTIQLTIKPFIMRKLKDLFSDIGSDLPSIFLTIWAVLMAALVIAGIFRIAFAISTGEVNFSNIQLV